MKPYLFPNSNQIRDCVAKSEFNHLLLAVSGGLDSICLAHYFIKNKEILGIEWLGIAHVHHGLRDASADRDAKFVQNFAERYNIPFFLKKLDGKALKASEGSLEENARDARYKALLEVVEDIASSTAIVTAHHAGDQAETMYLRLRRGVTLAGLHGIQEIRNLSLDPRLSSSPSPLSSIVSRHSSLLYRPFLNITREQLREYAIANNLSWCEDESNTDTKFARNKIRHISLPALEAKCQGATSQLCRIANLAEGAYKKTICAADKLFSQAIIPHENWPFEASLSPYKNILALDDKVLQKILAAQTSAFTSEAQAQGLCELFRLWLDSRGYRFPTNAFTTNTTKSSINNPQRGPDECPESQPHTSYHIPSFRYRTRFIEKCRNIIWIFDKHDILAPANLYFSNEKSRFSDIPGQWRHPCKEDVLWPLDMKMKACKLATWLQEKSIPHWIRDSLQVFAQDSRVLFVSGIRKKN